MTHIGKSVGSKDEYIVHKIYLARAWAEKKEAHGRFTCASLQIPQYFAYLRDHLLLGKNADIQSDYKSLPLEFSTAASSVSTDRSE